MKRFLILAAIVAFLPAALRAGDSFQNDLTAVPRKGWFDGGNIELELMSGVVGAPIVGDHTSYHYTDTELRLGWMLYSPHWSGFLRGNLELLANIGGGGVFEGPGSAFGSVGGMLRYNFVQPSARVVPYFQGGAGAFISNISDNRRQEDVGGTIEADLRAGVGTKFFICHGWSLDAEIFFEHVSNADTQTRNVGINALGGLVGISRSF